MDNEVIFFDQSVDGYGSNAPDDEMVSVSDTDSVHVFTIQDDRVVEVTPTPAPSPLVDLPQQRVVLEDTNGVHVYAVQEVTEQEQIDYAAYLDTVTQNQVDGAALTVGLVGCVCGLIVGLELLKIWLQS